ncbi:hypothetical protein HDU67_005731 [Dinochytrium kinnereticum]|nr:hypothetical protein HDU67_005731 [Dinochytrium kinnereticum]
MTPPTSRSSSPAPSISSTHAAERLSRLTDAQLADLSAQVSTESFRRRIPVGALMAAYEATHPSAASKLSIMSDEQFTRLASDLEAEAWRRDIPGIGALGRSRSGSRAGFQGGDAAAVLRGKFGGVNPFAGDSSVGLGSGNSISMERTGSSGSPFATFLIPVGAGAGAATSIMGTLPRISSATNISTLPASSPSQIPSPTPKPLYNDLSTTPVPDEDSDRTIWRLRLAGLPDDLFLSLRADLSTEIDRRRAVRRGLEPDIRHVELHDSGFSGTLRRNDSNSSSVHSKEELFRNTPLQDLWYLSEDTEAELQRRIAAGLLVPDVKLTVDAVLKKRGSPVAAISVLDKPKRSASPVAPAAEPTIAAVEEGKDVMRKPMDNVSAWKNRIQRLTDDQVVEVTSDVYDEMTRRRDKTGEFFNVLSFA